MQSRVSNANTDGSQGERKGEGVTHERFCSWKKQPPDNKAKLNSDHMDSRTGAGRSRKLLTHRVCGYVLLHRYWGIVSLCVALFLLNRYWGIVTVPGSFLKAVPGLHREREAERVCVALFY